MLKFKSKIADCKKSCVHTVKSALFGGKENFTMSIERNRTVMICPKAMNVVLLD